MLWKASLFFLLLIPILAYGEVGYDYDRIQLDEKTFQWTSHYPRIWDGSQWVNYLWSDDGNVITFESAAMKYYLDKNTCNFKVDGIDGYEKSLVIDGSNTSLSNCQVTNIDENIDGLQIIITESAPETELKTTFDLNAVGTEEWTYEISNKNILFAKQYSIEEKCVNCTVEKIDGDLIYLDGLVLDTKNRVHKTLKRIDENKDLTLGYDYKPVSFLEKAVIDPTFGFTVSTARSVTGAATTDVVCNTTYDADGTHRIDKPDSAISDDCIFLSEYWDISSIQDAAIPDSVILKIDNDGVGTAAVCDIKPMTTNPSTATGQQVLDDILDGVNYVTGSTICSTVANDQTVNLGSSAVTDLTSDLADDEFAIGIYYQTLTRGSNFLSAIFSDARLQVHYAYPDPIEINSSIVINNIGDVAQITGTMAMSNSTWGNLTSIKLIVNGTTVNTNSTGQNKTSIYEEMTVNFGPLWYQMNTDDIYNFTIQGTVQNTTTTESQIDSTLFSREYGPDYFTATVPSQGDVNYTFINNDLKINRDKGGATWQIECFIQDWSNTFFATDEGTWYNQTGIGYFSQHLVASSDYYASCYNDDALFLAAPLYSNFSSYLAPAAFIFDALGGFLGAPAVLMFVLAIFSWGTGRNFPVVIVIGVAALGIMGAMSLIVMASEFWAVIFVLAGIGVFGVRKFF